MHLNWCGEFTVKAEYSLNLDIIPSNHTSVCRSGEWETIKDLNLRWWKLLQV
jgi:hypothetical protein